MDWELLESWGIEKDSDPKKICEVLEERQLEFLQMRRNENDSAKKSELAEELKKLEAQLKQAKKEAKKQFDSSNSSSVGTISEPDASGDGQMAEMKKKLDAIKKQEEQRREEEKARIEAASADDTPDTGNAPTGSQPITPSPQTKPDPPTTPANRGAIPTGDSKQQLQSGIVEYNNGNYNAAFSIFNDLAQKGNPEAEYYVSILFSKGLGTAPDNDKANFWLKKSADHRYVEAQFAYAMTLLSNRSGTDPLSKEGMQYLAKAADQDYQPALKQYVDIVRGYHELPAIRSAIKYSSRLQSLLSDQYEIDAYKKKEEQLKNLLTESKRHESDGRVIKVIEVLSPILLVLGFIYLLGGSHPNEWDNNALLRFFPNVPEILIIPFRLLWILILHVFSVNGTFGLEIITLAFAGRSFYKAKQKTRIKGALTAVSILIIVVICVWHLLLVIIEGTSFLTSIVFWGIAIIVCRVLGLIVGKISVAVSNAKSKSKKVIISISILSAIIAINILPTSILAMNEKVRGNVVETTEKREVKENETRSFTVELVREDTTDYQKLDVMSVEADSSLISSKGFVYEPENMIDDDIKTSWQEGVDGAGEGHSIIARFQGYQKVDYIVIYNGNQKSEDSYYANNRIETLKVMINGQSSSIELEDSMNPQIVSINSVEPVDEIRLEIISVYNGDKYNDTCVAEVQFLCR